ncbi:hypothetical protein EJB05_28596, partial [Eragrostis curvula]
MQVLIKTCSPICPQETVPLSELSALFGATAAVFIPRKQWFVVGDWDGNLKVCSDETMQEVKTFSAHRKRIDSLDVHPSEPYVLSASYYDGSVKVWNWEMDWECVRTFHVVARQVKFNPKDADYFACSTGNNVKVSNIASPGSDDLTSSFGISHMKCFDYLSRGNELYLINGNHDGSVEIWDWKNRSCLKTLKEQRGTVATICAHPDLPIFITGSSDGTVCLWNSFTFELEGKLNCSLGAVWTIACLKGSNRVMFSSELRFFRRALLPHDLFFSS